MHTRVYVGEITCTSLHDIVQRNVMYNVKCLSFYFCLTICAQKALYKCLISYGLLHNASLVNNVPLLIRECRLIEQISAGWDDKPCQALKTPPNKHDAMHSRHWALMCVTLVICLLHSDWVQPKPSAKLGRSNCSTEGFHEFHLWNYWTVFWFLRMSRSKINSSHVQS